MWPLIEHDLLKKQQMTPTALSHDLSARSRPRYHAKKVSAAGSSQFLEASQFLALNCCVQRIGNGVRF